MGHLHPARSDQQHQRPALSVDQGMDLRAQSAAGTTYDMVRGFIKQIHVIRHGPCGAGKVGAMLMARFSVDSAETDRSTSP